MHKRGTRVDGKTVCAPSSHSRVRVHSPADRRLRYSFSRSFAPLSNEGGIVEAYSRRNGYRNGPPRREKKQRSHFRCGPSRKTWLHFSLEGLERKQWRSPGSRGWGGENPTASRVFFPVESRPRVHHHLCAPKRTPGAYFPLRRGAGWTSALTLPPPYKEMVAGVLCTWEKLAVPRAATMKNPSLEIRFRSSSGQPPPTEGFSCCLSAFLAAPNSAEVCSPMRKRVRMRQGEGAG